MELIIFIGLQAAGKSTYYQQRFAATHTLVSKDLLRNNAKPARRQTYLITAALQADQSVVVDNTNPTIADRAPLITLGHQYGATISGYYFTPDVTQSLRRNRQRVGKARVPDVAIFATRKNLSIPTFAEGFDHLSLVYIAADQQFVVTTCPPP